MKILLVNLLLNLSIAAYAEEAIRKFVFPPFSKEDITVPRYQLSNRLTYEEINSISVEEWRGIMVTAQLSDQFEAAKELIKRGDEQTILRLVYSMKQGNVAAEQILSESSPLAAVPYLMEDIAHGSLEYYGVFDQGDASFGSGRVRVAAVRLVAEVLANSAIFPKETKECLKAILSLNESQIQILSDESRYLIEWWLLNEDAFETGRWDEAKPLPQIITYGDPKLDTLFPRGERKDQAKQPPFGCPAWELPESFEVWAARIVDPTLRNFNFVALSWDGEKVVEHPAKSLDPKAKLEDRQSRKSPTPRTLPDPESGDRKRGISWIVAAAVLMLALSVVRLLRRRPSTGT